jgi:hypothetical protein
MRILHFSMKIFFSSVVVHKVDNNSASRPVRRNVDPSENIFFDAVIKVGLPNALATVMNRISIFPIRRENVRMTLRALLQGIKTISGDRSLRNSQSLE